MEKSRTLPPGRARKPEREAIRCLGSVRRWLATGRLSWRGSKACRYCVPPRRSLRALGLVHRWSHGRGRPVRPCRVPAPEVAKRLESQSPPSQAPRLKEAGWAPFKAAIRAIHPRGGAELGPARSTDLRVARDANAELSPSVSHGCEVSPIFRIAPKHGTAFPVPCPTPEHGRANRRSKTRVLFGSRPGITARFQCRCISQGLACTLQLAQQPGRDPFRAIDGRTGR